MRIIRSSRAERDMEDIWLFIAHDNPRAATETLDRIDDAIAKLGEYPNSGHIREELPIEVRVVAVGNYLILHEIVPEGLLILTVRHAARNLRAALANLGYDE